jgi:hypothetical protein
VKLKNINVTLFLFCLGIFLEGLDAYSILSIPLSWIGISLLVFTFAINFYSGWRVDMARSSPFKLWVFYVIGLTIVQALISDEILPKYASTTFGQYASLRLLKVFAFLIAIWLIHLLNDYLSKDQIITYLAYVGIAISILSLYSYFSYIFELPDFPRTRPGSGGWTQPIRRACSVLRNYGTFREPSFLAVWLAPMIPLILYLAQKKKYWYYLSTIPILCLVLTRSLTGIIGLILTFIFITLYNFIKAREVNIKLLLPIVLVLVASSVGNNLTYKFPALDPSMCPPYPSDQCDCSIYEDDLDLAKNSENISSSVFSRFSIIASGGLDAFENTSFLRSYIRENGLTIFGQGMGLSNISLSYAADEATKKIKDGQVVFRNPGQVVSFNNLFANLLMSTGMVGFIWFMYILSSIIRDLLVRRDELSKYMMAHLLLILFMFFFQAEELSILLGVSIGLITSLGKDNE